MARGWALCLMHIYTCSSVAEYYALYLSACERERERERQNKKKKKDCTRYKTNFSLYF
jgi:hypothetical protein